MKMLCSCALFPNEPYCRSIISQQIKHIWLAACQILPAFHLDIFMCFQSNPIILPVKVSQWSHKGLSCSFLHPEHELHADATEALKLNPKSFPFNFELRMPSIHAEWNSPRYLSLIISIAKQQLSSFSRAGNRGFCARQAAPQGKTALLLRVSSASICRTRKLCSPAIAGYLICQSSPINFTEQSQQKALTLQRHPGIKHWGTINATDTSASDEQSSN